jgi:hypothetical protein
MNTILLVEDYKNHRLLIEQELSLEGMVKPKVVKYAAGGINK